MCMLKNKAMVSVEEGTKKIMDILEESGIDTTKTIAPVARVYDGYGHMLAEGNKKTHKGYKKGAKRVKTGKNSLRDDLLDAAEVVLSRVVAFNGKVFRSNTEGVVVKLGDADYTVKCTAHAKAEFEGREAGFKASKSYVSRGNTVNHSAAIAKSLVAEFENQKPECSFGNQKLLTLLEAKASGVRFEFKNEEFSFKITKKRSRVIV